MTNSVLNLPSPEQVQSTITAWSAVVGLIAAGATHFLHLAISKWAQAGGWNGIKTFWKYGSNMPVVTPPVTITNPPFPHNMGETIRGLEGLAPEIKETPKQP